LPFAASRENILNMTRYKPFLTGSGRHAMGIKALDPADWIETGRDREAQLAERRRLLDERSDDVLATVAGSEPGQRELLALLLQHLERHMSDLYRVEPDAVVDLGSGRRFSRVDDAVSPLMLAGRLVQEDFCLLQRRSDAYHLVAAVLCFPAHWRLADKLDRPLLAIHQPVPGFAEQLGNPVNRLFERLQADRPVQRLNWSLVDTTDLYLPPSHRTKALDITSDNAGEKIWLRVERQTLRRLPVSDDIVFGIRTHLTSLGKAIDGPPAAEALVQRLLEMPAPVARYKNIERCRAPLLAYLERRRRPV
jgi:hypothetical protein